MAIEIMSKVFNLDIPTSKKFVLLVLADHCDHAGRSCYPSMDRISKKTSLSKNTVLRSIRWLVDAGYIQIMKKGNGRNHSHHYQLIISTLDRKGTTSDPFKGKGCHGGEKGCHGGSERVPPVVQNHQEPPINPSSQNQTPKPLGDYLKNLRTKH